jgi:hypothetical protein
MTFIGGGEIMRKSKDMSRIGEADSEMCIEAKTKMNIKTNKRTLKTYHGVGLNMKRKRFFFKF